VEVQHVSTRWLHALETEVGQQLLTEAVLASILTHVQS
jgi:hypothetical protein